MQALQVRVALCKLKRHSESVCMSMLCTSLNLL